VSGVISEKSEIRHAPEIVTKLDKIAVLESRLESILVYQKRMAELLMRMSNELKDSDGRPIGAAFGHEASIVLSQIDGLLKRALMDKPQAITRMPGETDDELRARMGLPPIPTSTPFLEAIK